MISVNDLLTEETVFPALKADSKTEVLNTLIGSLKISEEQRKAVKKAIFEREKIVPTGVGKGIAIPHCKIEAVEEDHGAFAILDEPVSFGSIDEKPVEYIFLLASPKDNDRKHLKLLSNISRILNNKEFRSKLRQQKSSGTILKAFYQQETKNYS